MDRRKFIQSAALLPLLANEASAELGRTAVSGWATRGELGMGSALRSSRFELTLDRVLKGQSPAYTEEFLLADVRPEPVRRFTEFSGDLSGRYIGALATAARVHEMEFPGLDALVAKVIALQKPEGYFGAAFHAEKLSDADLALLWGNGRLLVGLLEYHRLKAKEAALTSSRRLGDWLVEIGPLMLSDQVRQAFGAQHFASSYICWTQQTEGLALLYAVTHDARYRDLAMQIAAVIERRPGDHVHGYLSSLRGVMELYAATQEAPLLRQCEQAWEDISASKDALITGGVPEGWSPNNHRTEGCAEADWVRLNLQLSNATRKPIYIQTAERAVFNELAFNQFATGDFGHRVYTETGFAANGAARAWWCCTLHGLRAFPDIESSAFRVADDGLWYELPLSGQIKTDALSATADSSLSEDGTVRIRIIAAKPASARLRVRKPVWAESVTVLRNASERPVQEKDGYVVLDSPIAAGDEWTVRYGMKLRANPEADGRVSFWYGPWLLGAAAAENPAYFNELTAENRLIPEKARPLVAQGRGTDSPRRVSGFTVPIAATEFACVPAEFPDQLGTVVLRPIAEQTALETTSWELRFVTRRS